MAGTMTTARPDRPPHGEVDARGRGQWVGLWERVLLARLIGAIGLGIGLVLVPSLGPARLTAALIVLAAIVGSGYWVVRRVRAGKGIGWHLAVGDPAIILGLIALVPALYAAGAVALVTTSAYSLHCLGGRRAPFVAAPTALALLALGLWQQPAGWGVVFAAWCATATVGLFVLDRLAAMTRSLPIWFDDLVNGLDAAIWEGSGPSGGADFVSDRAAALFGLSADHFASLAALTGRIHPDDLARFEHSRHQVATGTDAEVRYRLKAADGTYRHVLERVCVELDPEGAVVRRRGIVIDETARWVSDDAVRRFSELVQQVPLAMVVFRLDDLTDASTLRIVASNPAAAPIVGHDAGDPWGRYAAEFVPSLVDQLAEVARAGEMLEQTSVELGNAGAVYRLRAVALGEQHIGLTLEDVTEQARDRESLHQQALHDHLTGLPNRARFNERLDAVVRDAQDGHRAALLLMDLNKFKDVNDSLGHEVGDRLLVELGSRLSRHLRDCDTIARLGGDEFAVIVSDLEGESAGVEVAERLVELASEPFNLGGSRVAVGASVGIAVAPDHATEAAELSRLADASMYRAKEAGGGIIVHGAAPRSGSGMSKFDLVDDLREAIDDRSLIVHYQPRIALATMRPVGVEALVRWHHPLHGLLQPSSFIEVAEVSGTIERITKLVTERATADIASLPPGFALTVNVNLSARNLRDSGLVEWVRETLERTGFPPASLCFELTEPQLLEDPGATLETLHGLRHLGVRLSVDDFGTGYSSLSYLRELPVDEVKIDRKFINDLEAGDTTIVRSVIDLGHNMGLHVVAEGVESDRALTLLREMGCDSAQGYHLGAPMSVTDLYRYLGSPADGTTAVPTPPPVPPHLHGAAPPPPPLAVPVQHTRL